MRQPAAMASLPLASVATGSAGAPPRPVSIRAVRAPLSIRTLVAVTDVVTPLLVLSVVVAVETWRRGGGRPHLPTLVLFVAVTWGSFLLASVVVRLRELTRRHLMLTSIDGLGRAVCSVLLGAAGVLAVDTLLRSALEPVVRPQYVVASTIACVLALPAARLALLAACAHQPGRRQRVVVVGTGTIADDMAKRLSRSRLVDLVGLVDDAPAAARTLGPLDDLPALCARRAVDRVIVTFSTVHPGRVTEVLRRLPASVTVDVVPRYFELTGPLTQVTDVFGLAVCNIGEPPRMPGRVVKRTIDVVGAAVVVVVTAPLVLVAGAAVALSSPGPVLFRQDRLGRRRRPFQVFKLRTMYQAAPGGAGPYQAAPGGAGPYQAAPGAASAAGTAGGDAGQEHPDAAQRITPVGRLLRRSGIDELPQLLNVLRGEMSLVGPRPFVPEECRALPAWAERRFALRPGLTGLWQVSGQHELRIDELYRLDVQYVSTWSLLADARILARTPRRLMEGGGDRDAFRFRQDADQPPAAATGK